MINNPGNGSIRYGMASRVGTAFTTDYAVAPVYLDADGALTTDAMDVAKQGIGASRAQTFFASVTRVVAGTMTGITFKVQGSYDGADPTDPDATNWRDIAITNLETSASAVEQSVTGVDDETVLGIFGTSNAANFPYCRVLSKAVGAAGIAGESGGVIVVAS